MGEGCRKWQEGGIQDNSRFYRGQTERLVGGVNREHIDLLGKNDALNFVQVGLEVLVERPKANV